MVEMGFEGGELGEGYWTSLGVLFDGDGRVLWLLCRSMHYNNTQNCVLKVQQWPVCGVLVRLSVQSIRMNPWD